MRRTTELNKAIERTLPIAAQNSPSPMDLGHLAGILGTVFAGFICFTTSMG
jgi:hypothetical protein